jgi:hypothetical protein
VASASENKGATPPDPFDGSWFLHIQSQTIGPYTGREIARLAELNKIGATDLVYSATGQKWEQAQHDEILGSLFVASPISFSTAPGHRSRKRLILVLAASLLLLATFWLAWPYYAIYELTIALREGDVVTLENRVAWDSLRRSLRDDLNALILQQLKKNPDETGKFGAGLATLIGPTIVNNIVDGYVTPQAIATAAKENRKTEAKQILGNEVIDHSSFDRTIRTIDFTRIRYAFFAGSPFSFKVEFNASDSNDEKYNATSYFHWDGTWRLTRIVLPASVYDRPEQNILSNLKQPALSPSQKTEEVSLAGASPVSVTLLDKNFEAMDFKKNSYQDRINFTLAIKNISGKDIRAFDGTLKFTDLLDNRIIASKLEINDPIKNGDTFSWSGSMSYNPFMEDDKRFRVADRENIKLIFVPRKTLFADGTVKAYDK